MRQRAELLGMKLRITELEPGMTPAPHTAGNLNILPVKTSRNVTAGRLDTANAGFVLKQIELAARGCLSGQFDAMVTAPAHKAIINQSGHVFSGHTEYLAQLCDNTQPVMMLCNRQLRVILVTTHLPLQKVAETISPERLERVLRIASAELSHRFRLAGPRLLVCGLNPHAGEEGEFGDEEIRVIRPCIEKLKSEGLQIEGPVPADTAYTSDSLANVDAVVAMYHDQGLPVLKAQGFGETVNITLGLPIIRTSVDHGTALTLAGSGRASADSLFEAVQMAIELANNENSS